MTSARLRLSLLWIAVLAPLLRAADSAPEAAPDAAQVKAEQEKLAGNFKILAQALEKSIKGKVVAMADVRAENESADSPAIKLLQSDLLQALMLRGIIVFPFETERKLTPKRTNGKLATGILFAREDADFLKSERKADLILTARADISKTTCTLRVELRDLATVAVLSDTALPAISFDKVPLVNSCELDLLPRMNRVVLGFAAGNIGRKIDRGECWDLPAVPMREQSIRIRDYTFGKKVKWDDALPGDVLTTSHHVMVLVKPAPDRKTAVILHQNTNGQRFVVLDRLPGTLAPEVTVWRPGQPEK
jgi:hypothetical protein